MITTGTCPSGHLIMETAVCEAAATAFSMSDTTCSTGSYSSYNRPQGCCVISGYLYIQDPGSGSCSNDIPCLCMLPYGETAPPSPSPTPDPFPASSRFAVTYREY